MSGNDRAAAFGQLFAARNAVASPAQNLTDDLQAAVTVSQSPTLGSNLFILLDHLRLTMDAVATTPVLDDGNITPADVYALGSLRANAIEAVNPLYAIVLDEMDKLIVARLDQIGTERDIAIAALALAVVIAFLPSLALVLTGIQARRRPAPAGRHGLPESPTGEVEAPAARPYPAWAGSGSSMPGSSMPGSSMPGSSMPSAPMRGSTAGASPVGGPFGGPVGWERERSGAAQ
jgi:hypothetical protein